MLEASLTCVMERVEHEGEKVKGSRFIGVAAPARSADEACALAEELWAQHPNARHVCWAYRGEGRDELRWADDGEPTGTAGRPILSVIEGSGLSWVTVAVVRYFGGTKLGTGGLARAYSEAASEVLKRAERVELSPKVDLRIKLSYPYEGGAQRLITSWEGQLQEARYEAEVELWVTLDASRVDQALVELSELSLGSAQVERSEPYLGA